MLIDNDPFDEAKSGTSPRVRVPSLNHQVGHNSRSGGGSSDCATTFEELVQFSFKQGAAVSRDQTVLVTATEPNPSSRSERLNKAGIVGLLAIACVEDCHLKGVQGTPRGEESIVLGRSVGGFAGSGNYDEPCVSFAASHSKEFVSHFIRQPAATDDDEGPLLVRTLCGNSEHETSEYREERLRSH